MRGGTSKGPYFRLADLPDDPAIRDRILLAAMGSPDPRQIDGIGGADTLTSKVAMVGPSAHPKAQIDFLFAQVSVDKAIVDTGPTCGNILAGIAPFALECGMVAAAQDETRVTIHAVNTGGLVEALVQTPGGQVEYEGDATIDGVPGSATPVILNFLDAVGSKTGALLPTGREIDLIEGVETSCVDVAMPMVMMRAADLGKTGYEGKAEIDSDAALLARIEAIRSIAGERMGLGDVSAKVIPKVGLLAPPRGDGDITSRYFVPHELHAAHAVSGAICVASACLLEGSVAGRIAHISRTGRERVRIEHPSGWIDVVLETEGQGADTRIARAGALRTARKLFAGHVFVPAHLWEAS